MFHLLLMVCISDSPCDERWLPLADRPDQTACEAMAATLGGQWAEDHGVSVKSSRCVPTDALPALSLQSVAPGVWIHRGADAEAAADNGGAIANLGVIEAPDSVIVIDPGGSRAEGEGLLAAIRQRTEKPVAAAILTHAHPDHVLGAEPFHEVGAEIIAHHRLAEALAARIPAYSTTYRASIGDAAWIGSAFVLPDSVISQPVTHAIGGAHLTLSPQPPAHTDSDLTVYHTESGVLFAGDLLFDRLTPVLDGSIIGWLDWLSVPPSPQPSVIVPGHGPVSDNWDAVSSPTRDYLDALAAAVRTTVSDNLALSDAVPAVLMAMQPQAEGWIGFADTTRRNAAAAYHELEWE